MDATNKIACYLHKLLMEKVYSRIYGIDCTENTDALICEASIMLSISRLLDEVDSTCDTEDFEDQLDDYVHDLDTVTLPDEEFTLDCEIITSVEAVGVTCSTIEISIL